MSGIFISYASEDRDRARTLAHALEQRGWPVWWDREIPFGKTFDEVIEQQLAHAQCVLVLWSKASVESRWVRAEASAAAARGVLIPVLLERDVGIPLQFRLLHAADLSDWTDTSPHSEFQSLAVHIESMLEGTPEALNDSVSESTTAAVVPPAGSRHHETSTSVSTIKEPGQHQKLRHALTFVLLPTVLVGTVALSLMNWRMTTPFQLDLVVSRMSFTTSGEQSVEVPVNPLTFRSLTIENFDRVQFTPEKFVLGSDDDSRTVDSGTELTLEGSVDAMPALTITSAKSVTAAAGQLEQLVLAPPSELIIEVSNEGAPRLTIRVFDQELRANVLPASSGSAGVGPPVLLDFSVLGATLVGADGASVIPDPQLRNVALAEYAPYVAMEGTRSKFAVTATLDASGTVRLGEQLPVRAVTFLEQDSRGQTRTALVAPGKLAYPGYPDISSIALEAEDSIEVGELEDAKLSRLILDPEQGRLDLRLEGEAGRLVVNAKSDYRLTAFDRLWNGPRTTVLFAIMAWGFSVTIGGYKLYRDLANSR
jgi:hypothetical protein